jgi:hypothetical protein
MAIAGYTYDNTLTGLTMTSYVPYIAMSSIAISGNYYWAKAFSL